MITLSHGFNLYAGIRETNANMIILVKADETFMLMCFLFVFTC